MIVQETYLIGERSFTRTYSDRNMKIHGGFPEADYDEANDPTEFGRTYTETNIPIESDDDKTEGEKAIDVLETILGEEIQ